MSKIRYQNLENGKYPRTKVESAEAIAVVLQTDPEVIFPMFMSAKAAHDAAEAERVDAENLQAYAVVVDPDAVRSAAEAAGVSSLISVKMCATHFLRRRGLPASSAPCPACFSRITDELLRRPSAKKHRAGVARTLYRWIGAFWSHQIRQRLKSHGSPQKCTKLSFLLRQDSTRTPCSSLSPARNRAASLVLLPRPSLPF